MVFSDENAKIHAWRNADGADDRRRDRQVVAMTHPVIGKCGEFATCEPVATQVILLQMRRVDIQHVAIPFAERETRERMRVQRPGSLTSVEPDRAFHLLEIHPEMNPNDLLCNRIANVFDAHVRQSAHHVIAAMWAALILRDDRNPIGDVAVAAQTSSLIDWYSRVIADFRSRNALGIVFVIKRCPVAGEIHLCQCGRTWQACQQRHCRAAPQESSAQRFSP